ncbi:MAG: hypothetical protein HY019_17920 [Aquabacterium sp.]|uniref:hypothetical protein n=1 Tax=Aquabacterium sp. TaxID=1872578 RepID=UPI0025B82767|nr:hypothetical protein [Aquabacterium sp.]MBI3383886.1 hypothetical protein [Aquabacterium sp.]
MSRQLTLVMASLLCVGPLTAHARELNAADPVRASLVSLARDAQVDGLPSDSRLSFSLAWVDGAQAKVCAAARGANGDLLIQDGQLQLKRVLFQKRGSRWAVERAEHLVMGQNQSIVAACEHRSPDTHLAAALKEMDMNPPTAGVRAQPAADAANAPKLANTASSTNPANAAHCRDTEPKRASPQPSGSGVVGLPGRSLLHFAPDLACFMGKHIVGGDKVQILAHVPGWTRVSYTHPITHVTTRGWVKSERVRLNERTASSL